MRKLTACLMATLVSFTGALFAATDASYQGVKYSTKGDVIPGEWTCQFTKGKEYSEKNDIPMVVFWGNSGCPHCVATEQAMASKTFTDWQKERGLVMVFTVGSATPGNNGALAYAFCRNNSTSIPRMAVYWKGHKLGDGTQGQARLNVPDYTAAKLIALIEKYVKGYVPSVNSDFGFEESDCNRYEAEASTTNVTVTLTRKTGAQTLAETLTVLATDGKTVYGSYAVDWAVGETNKAVAVAIAKGTFAKDGQQLTLQVKDKGGAVKAETHVTYVVKGNSAANPDWVGEELAFGRWTSDLDGAKQYATASNGYTLVSIQGSMWCPDCANTDRNFLEVTNGFGEVCIKKWASDKKVMLVSMDIPNYQGPNVTDCATPTLFSKDAYATTLARAREYPQSGADASLTNAIVRSGLGYQTRKGISAEVAEKQLKKFHDLAYLNTDKGGFHRPEDDMTSKNWIYRTGVPIFVLLRADGSVAARFTNFALTSPMASDRANFGNYLKRFDEMLALAADEGEFADATEIANNYPCVEDGLTLAANGGEMTSTLCNADFQDAVKLTGLSGAAKLMLTVSGPSSAAVTVQLYRLADGKVTTVGSVRKCEKLSDGLTFTESLSAAGTYFALVKGADITSAGFAAESAAADHFISYTLEGSAVYRPGEATNDGVTDTAGKAPFVLASNEVYRITKIDATACAGVLEHKGGDFYRSLVTGETELSFLTGVSPHETFEYQLWKSGKVGFLFAGETVPESVNDKDGSYYEVRLVRTGGSSGTVQVKVSLDEANTDFYNAEYDPVKREVVRGDARFEFSPTNVVWADGDSAEKIVYLKVKDDSENMRYDGDGKIVLLMGDPIGPAMDVAKGTSVFTLSVIEDDRAEPGRAMFTRVDPYWGKSKTVYVREGDGAYLYAQRIEASEGLFGVEVKSSLAGVGFATANPRDLTTETSLTGKEQLILWWANKESAEKYLYVTNVPAGKSAKITLNNYRSGDINCKVVTASNTVTVVSVADDAPYYETDAASATLYRYVSCTNSYKVRSTGGTLTFAKLSGSLPAGLTVKYDAAAGAMSVFGVPTASNAKTGSLRYESVYQVTETRVTTGTNGLKTTKKVPGLTIRLVYDVIDPAGGTSSTAEPALNDFFVTKRTYTDIPVLDREDGLLAGTLQVTIPRTGKASAKLLCALGTLSFSAKSWNGILTDDGTLSVELACTTKGYSLATLRILAANTGDLAYLLTGAGLAYDGAVVWRPWSSTQSAESYKGSYVVAMPTNAISEMVEGLAPSGAPYLTLKMTSKTQWNAGKMTWAGALANGTAISGTAVLTEEQLLGGKIARLPVVKQSKTDFFSAWLQIGSNDKTVSVPVVDKVPVCPTWDHQETAKALSNAVWSVRYDLYGGIYVAPADGTYTLTFDGPLKSQQYGEVTVPTVVPKLSVTSGRVKLTGENPDAVKLSLASTGVVSGSFKLWYDDGTRERSLSATYKGVAVVGFEGRPMLSGAWVFSDKYQKTTIKRGAAVIGE